MTKRKFNYIFDVLFYTFFILMPIIAYIIHLHHYDNVSLIDFYTQFGIIQSNVIYTSLVDIFGTNGVFPIIADNSVLFTIFTYMIIVNLIHLMVDFLLFIPNICHKYLNYFYQSEK